MNTLLTAPDIEYLKGQQMKLDEEIIEKHGLTNEEWEYDLEDNHIIALRVEVAEFVNCTYDHWKYWKKKPIDRDRIIDEAVDVIHFIMLHLNKERYQVSTEDFVQSIVDLMPYKNKEITFILNIMLVSTTCNEIMACLLFVLDHYNFTTQDIIDAYNRKNKENFERLESGY